MRKFFVLVWMFVVCLSLFGEGNPKDPHICYSYLHPTSGFVPNWFDYLEFADDNISAYDREFLQEHGGRAGTIVFQIQDDRYPRFNGKYYTGCSGTLIGENYFLTAGHCAVTNVERDFPTEDGTGTITLDVNIKNVGVLFGYQVADIFDDNDMSSHPTYPRVSLKGYLKNNLNYMLYTDSESEYLGFMEHPAYFPIDRNPEFIYNTDMEVEHGWENVGWDENNPSVPLPASEMTWPNDDTTGEKLGKIDYAIYKLGTNAQGFEPENVEDPWPWRSDNNHSSQNLLLPPLNLPWALPDNTNGYRGWARVNTAVLQATSDLNVIGFPGVARISVGNDEITGLKVVNAGYVVDGEAKKRAHSFDEDVLVFNRADIYFGNSGSSVIDYSGRLAGVVSWSGCFRTNTRDIIVPDIQFAENYATPMWKICRASKIIKDAARDQNCNGQVDWWDFIEEMLSRFTTIDLLGINEILLNNLTPSSSTSVLQNYRYNATQQKVVTETKSLPAYTYQVTFQNNGNLFYVAKQNNTFYLFQNGTALGAISNYPELSGSAALVKDNDIYLAGGSLSIPTPMLPGSGNNSFQPYITKISSNGQNGYNFSGVATIPANLEDIRIFALGNDIYVSGNTTSNFAVYKLIANNQSEYGYSLSLVSDTTQPTRKDYNLTAADGKIIVSGGATDYISTVLNLDEAQYPSTFAVYNNIIMLEPAVSNNWVTVAENINDKLIMMSVTAIEDGKLIIVNPFISVGNSMQKIVMDLSEIPINGEHLRVDFEFDPLVYCSGFILPDKQQGQRP